MKLLIIDTSTSVCSVAVVSGRQVLAEILINLPGPSSSRLSEGIEQAMSSTGLCLAGLDGFGVTTGPGAFTSLRVGLSTVKGLALATGKPVAAISSLALLAAGFPWASMTICPLFDARKGEVYAGLYRCDPLPQPLRPDCVTTLTTFLTSLPERTLFVGDGAERYQPLIEEILGERACFAPAWANIPRAVTASALVSTMIAQGRGSTAADLLPTYLRRSEAETARLALDLLPDLPSAFKNS